MNAGPGFVHTIDPVLFQIGTIKTYWYGAAYTLGFLGLHLWLSRRRAALGWHAEEVFTFSIVFMVSVLLCGRGFSVLVYQWSYYRDHLDEIASYWRGGMASHGVLLGSAVGTVVFCWWRRRSLVRVADEVVIPGALFMALGRIGNFINGEIAGYPTDVWWAVKFPDLEEFRHPVTLYESLKNFALIPILLWVRRRHAPGSGYMLAHFVFWYGFLRLFADYFRDYGGEFLGVGKGQYFNLFMSALGLALWTWFARQRSAAGAGAGAPPPAPGAPPRTALTAIKRAVFVGLLVFSLVIPSGWSQGVLKELREQRAGFGASAPAHGATSAASPGRSASVQGDVLVAGPVLQLAAFQQPPVGFLQLPPGMPERHPGFLDRRHRSRRDLRQLVLGEQLRHVADRFGVVPGEE